ncbi:hypothetical protein ASC76_19215 [Rhizobacter sp. Root404]|nr:hypothetical protein ASC76_19215 [Rhizobacter sp. Root404]
MLDLDATASVLDAALHRDTKMTVLMLRTLVLLAQRGEFGATQEDLQRTLRISQAAASRLMSRLSNHGSPSPCVGTPLDLASLTLSPTDARVRVLKLNARGRRLLHL